MLIQSAQRKERKDTDAVAKDLGIHFSDAVREETISNFADHPITQDLEPIRYRYGSVVSKAPKGAITLGFLSTDEPVMGMAKLGKGKVIYVRSSYPLLHVPKKLIQRILNEAARAS